MNDPSAEELYSLLQEETEKKTLFLVEGEKDKKALQFLGIEFIITLRQRPLYTVVEQVAGICKEVIILTDLDKTGKKLYSILASALQRRGVKINNQIRTFLFRNTTLQQIEGIDTYLQKRLPLLF